MFGKPQRILRTQLLLVRMNEQEICGFGGLLGRNCLQQQPPLISGQSLPRRATLENASFKVSKGRQRSMAESGLLRVFLAWRATLGATAMLGLCAMAYSDAAWAARRPLAPQSPLERDESSFSDSDEADFDSGFVFGIGMWRTPALPRLLAEGEYQELDMKNYRKEAQALAAVIETRLFFPFLFLDLPLGISILTSQALTESSALSFTISSNKGAIRPKHSLALNIGVRADYSLGPLRTESSLELMGNHIVYLGANITALGPAFRVRGDSAKAFSVISGMGARPLIGVEVYGSPYLTVSNYDNRISTESSGQVRDFPDLVQLAKSGSGWMFGTQVEGGFTWTRRDKSRDQSVLLIWNYTQYRFNKLLERVVKDNNSGTGSTSFLDANSVINAVSIGFRSTFL